MPHIIVKLYPGRSEQQKIQLTEKIVQDVVATVNCEEKTISVAFEESNQKIDRKSLQTGHSQQRTKTLQKARI